MNCKQIVSTAVMTALALSLAGCAEPEQDTVTIAVIGNEADLYPGYKDGTEKAAEDARSEYEMCIRDSCGRDRGYRQCYGKCRQ